MPRAVPQTRPVVLINGVAIAAFLIVGSRHWMSERAAQDASLSEVQAGMAWELCALLLVLVAALINSVVVIRTLRNADQKRRSSTILMLSLIIICWAIAFLFDAAHNGVRVR
jgi:hypothetical protein